MGIWILLAPILFVAFYIYSKIVDPSQALYKKVLKKEEDALADLIKDSTFYPDPKRAKESMQKSIKEIKSDQDLYLRLLERVENKRDLKKIKNDYYNLLHSKDEINTIVGIDPSSMEDALQKYHIKVEEIGKRFRSYGLEKIEP